MTSDEQRAASGASTDPSNGTSDHLAPQATSDAANSVTNPDRLDLLDRYWDAMTGNSFQPAQSIALDPAHARTIDLLQTLTNDQTAGMPADARARIWRVTADQASIPSRQESPVTAPSIQRSGPATPSLTLPASNPARRRRPAQPGGPVPPNGRWSIPGNGGPSQPTGRTWWPRLQFAVAAALILGLFATILAPMDDGRIGLFGGIGNDATPTAETQTNEFTGGGGSQTVPVFNDGLDLRLYLLTLSPDASFDLPAGPGWRVHGYIGNAELITNGEGGEPLLVNPSHSSGTESGGTLHNIVDQESIFWVFGLIPRQTELTTPSSGEATVRELGRQDVSILNPGSVVNLGGVYSPANADPRPLVSNGPPSDASFQPVPASPTAGIVYANRGQIQVDDVPDGDGPMTLSTGESVTLDDLGEATVTGLSIGEDEQTFPDTFYVASVQPYGFTQGDATPRTEDRPSIADIPSIGYPDAFTGGGLLVDLPVSASGHRVTIDRVTIAEASMLTLPPGAVYQAASVTGLFTVERANGSLPLSVDRPSIVDIDSDGGAILADQGEEVTVTVLTIAPDGGTPLASSEGITVYPLTTYTTGGLRFDSHLNVLFGSGPAPVEPDPVGPSAIADHPQNLADAGTTMLLYAEQGSIRITASADVIEDPMSSDELPVFVSELTIVAGETAVVSNPSLTTIQQATPGEGAVYTVAFLAPPALDRTVGRTYPNTAGGSGGIQPVPADGDDYQIVLDRLTLDPGATTIFPPGTIRAVQWTGGGLATMTSDETARPTVVFAERSLGASFEDEGFRIASMGDTPVTLTLMSYLPAGSSDETVPTGQVGLTGERLAAYTATNPFNAEQLQFSFYAAAAEGFPVEIDPGIGLNIGGGTSVDAYALIRPEGGPIVLNRPARRIVDGAETTEIAAGSAVIPGETVRVDDLLDATLQGPTDGTLAGYTIVVVSPHNDPSGNRTDVVPRAPITGLTPANIETVVNVAADQPLTMALVRQTLAPNATMTINPVYALDGVSISPITVVSYAATGDAMISLAGEAGTELSDRSNQVAMSSLTSATPITIRAGANGITIYELVIGPVQPEFSVKVTETRSGTEVIGAYSAEDLFAVTGSPGDTVAIEVALRSSVNALGDGSSQTLGRDSAITLLTPLVGNARITPGVGEVRVATTNGDDPIGTVTTISTTLAPGGSLVALPGGAFRVASETDTDSLSYLWAEISISLSAPDATPAAVAPAAGTPSAVTIPACDITPRTVEELQTLYDEGTASPVDPLALSHRDDLGTGTPAGDETIAAITGTLLRQSACQNLDDPLRQYALYSDDALRYVLPLIYETPDALASLLVQPPAQASEAAIGNVTVSDVEPFTDGRVGARVALEGEFAYVTFIEASDGTWLMDVFDDRDEPGTTDEEMTATPVEETPVAATPVEGTPVTAMEAPLTCDVAPRSVEDLLTLYDEGVANPVDPFTLGHRDDAGTGTPANDETAAAITSTLLRLAACQGSAQQLQSYALYSDDALRVILPITFQNRDELIRLPEQLTSPTTTGPSRDVAVYDIEVFADGQVGARVVFGSESAYITFVQAQDGTWLIDLFDDREQADA